MRTQFMTELAPTKTPGNSGTGGKTVTDWRFFSAMSFLQACLPTSSARTTNLEVHHCYQFSDCVYRACLVLVYFGGNQKGVLDRYFQKYRACLVLVYFDGNQKGVLDRYFQNYRACVALSTTVEHLLTTQSSISIRCN